MFLELYVRHLPYVKLRFVSATEFSLKCTVTILISYKYCSHIIANALMFVGRCSCDVCCQCSALLPPWLHGGDFLKVHVVI
jgi:hypothetical protein